MEESNRKGFNEDDEQHVRRTEEVEGHHIRGPRAEELPSDDDAPEVEGHRMLSPEKKYKKA